MACGVKRGEPFDTDYAGAMGCALDASLDTLKAIAQLHGETAALRWPASGIADPNDIVDDVLDRTWVQCEDGRLPKHRGKGLVQLIRRHSADMAEVLGHYQIGLRLPQEMVFQPIEPLP